MLQYTSYFYRNASAKVLKFPPPRHKTNACRRIFLRNSFLHEYIRGVYSLARIQENTFEELFSKHVFVPCPFTLYGYSSCIHTWCQYIKYFWGITFNANTCGACICTRANAGKDSWQIIFCIGFVPGGMPSSWQKAFKKKHHHFVSRYGSHLYLDTFAEVLGSGVVETPPKLFRIVCANVRLSFETGESPKWRLSNGGLRPLSATRAESSAIVRICGLMGPFAKGIFAAK